MIRFSTLLLLTTLLSLQLNAAKPMRVMSYNLRFDNPADGVNQWSSRKEKVFTLIRKYQPDIIGVQEALQHQLVDIVTNNSTYAYIGVGRDDGKTAGEYSAIIYNKKRFVVLEQNTFWLSETPETPGSKNWDAAITRVATWAKLKDKKTKKEYFVLNTHFDHIGAEARLKSAELIKSKLTVLAGNLPVIVTGDFNCEPTEAPYTTITNSEQYTLTDAGNGSTEGTYCTFAVNGPPCKRIDYIFYSADWTGSNYQVLHDNDGKHYPSDHLPIMSIFALTKK